LMCKILPIGFLYVGKEPKEFLRRPSTINIVVLLSQKLDIPCQQVTPTFSNGPYTGTWVHSDLAINLAMYCDKTGELQLAVTQAIRALADRPIVATAPAPSTFSSETFPEYQELRAKADGILAVTAAEERAFELTKQKLAMHPDLLAAKKEDLLAEERAFELTKQKLAMHPDLLAAKKEDLLVEQQRVELQEQSLAMTYRFLRQELRIKKKDRQDRRLHVRVMVEMKRALHAINSGTQMCWS